MSLLLNVRRSCLEKETSTWLNSEPKWKKIPKSSKRWVSLNKQLLNKQAAPTLTSPLKNKEGLWCRTPETKANAFAECWAEKCQLPPKVFEQFFACTKPAMSDWFPIRRRNVKKLLMALKLDQATGPDGFSVLLLRKLAKFINMSLAILIRRILNEVAWPSDWRLHQIFSLFERGSVYMPGQYRGIHLISILSKTVELTIGQPLVAFCWKSMGMEMPDGRLGRSRVPEIWSPLTPLNGFCKFAKVIE